MQINDKQKTYFYEVSSIDRDAAESRLSGNDSGYSDVIPKMKIAPLQHIAVGFIFKRPILESKP